MAALWSLERFRKEKKAEGEASFILLFIFRRCTIPLHLTDVDPYPLLRDEILTVK